MSINKNRLFEFLEILDENLTEHVVLVAAGGTAMTLLDLKPSTKDIDFVVAHNYDLFKKIEKGIPHGYDIDAWPDRQLFSQRLPDDYLEKSIDIPDTFQHLSLKALHPVDIVVTKIGRLDERDKEDIKDCIKGFNLTKQEIKKRAKQMTYVGSENHYQIKFGESPLHIFQQKLTG